MAEEKETSKDAEPEAKTTRGMLAVDEIIDDFGYNNRAIQQQNKFAATLDNVNDKIKNFDDRKKINYQIKFICAFNHNILTAASGRVEIYATTKNFLIRLIAFFEVELHEKAIFYSKANKDELARTQSLIDTFLQLLQKNIKFKKNEAKETDAEKLEEHINLTNTSIAQIIGAIKERLKEVETVGNLDAQAKNFTAASKKYKKNAVWFLVGAGGIFLLFVCAIFVLTNYFSEVPLSEAKEAKEYIYFYIALKTIFSLRVLLSVSLLVILFASIRFYAANKHNAVVCDQRANTLKSYKALRNSATAGEERLLVLQKILDAATDHQPSGFSKEDKDGDSLIGKSLAELVILLRGKPR